MLVLHIIPVGCSLLHQIAQGTLPTLRKATGRNQELNLDCLGLT